MKKLIAAIVLVLACSAYAGEKPLSLQVFPYAGGWFGDDYLGQSGLYGGRIGFNFNRFIGLEVGYEFLPNEFRDRQHLTGDVDGNHFYGDITLSPFGGKKFVPYILLGGGDLLLNAADVSDPADQWTAMWGLGLKYYFNEWLGVRAEARQINISDKTALNLAATAGIQIRLGGRGEPKVVEAPRVVDSDGDTVADSADQCPDTPRGATVDAVGCPHDSDGDGVWDGIDQCPDTPAGAKVDNKGCSSDSDGDTVPDGIDQCPKTPKGETVNAFGCQLDADGDTVLDGSDQCPNTPAGAKVDAKGCPMDSDGDTVPDGIDQCPDTPKGTAVDEKGCPAEAAGGPDTDGDTVPDNIDRCPHTVAGGKVDAEGCEIIVDRLVLKGIKFKTGKSIIEPASYPILNSVAETLKAHPELRVEIQGYTDSKGARASNMKLSLARAKAVHAYLVKKGIPAKQMTFKGYGPDNPIGDNNTDAGRAENRRIEFKVIK